MTADEAVVAVFAALDAAHIPNMLVGSLASNFHGIPRDDIRNMLAIRGRELDWAYIDRWTAAHDTTQLLAEIRASVPPV